MKMKWLDHYKARRVEKKNKKRILKFDQFKLDRQKKQLSPNQSVHKYGEDILKSANFMSSAQNIQHGTMSVQRHSIQVAKYSLVIAKKLGIKCNKRTLIRGALLHDYFLYDWHDPEHKGLTNLHGLYHPGIALQNAKREYKLSKQEQDVIKKHMWPLTVVPPTCREAWIVSMADKYCSLMETFHVHKGYSVKRTHARHQEVKKVPLFKKILRVS